MGIIIELHPDPEPNGPKCGMCADTGVIEFQDITDESGTTYTCFCYCDTGEELANHHE